MAGKPGQKSTKVLVPPKEYRQTRVDQLDGRYRAVRVLRGRWQALAADLGGPAELSYQEQSLLQRFVHLEFWIQTQEQKLLAGQPINETMWMASLNSFLGLIGKIGLKRRARPIKSLQEYLQTKEESHG